MWFPQRIVDYAVMERAAAQAAYDELHKDAAFHDGTWKNWASERSKDFPFHYMDGVNIVVTAEDINPDDHFTTKRTASPLDQRDQTAAEP